MSLFQSIPKVIIAGFVLALVLNFIVGKLVGA